MLQQMYKVIFFFGFSRRDSLSNILFNLGLPSFDTVMANAAVSFWRLQNGCNNRIVLHTSALSWTNDIISVHFILRFLLCFVFLYFECFYVLYLSGPCCLI